MLADYIDTVTIGDCLKVMSNIEDNSVDVCFADPPFNLEKKYGSYKDQMHSFGALVSDVWTDIHRIRHSVRRDEHPCQLPVPLLERIVLMSTDPGDVVLDPFLGTGTTAIAAKTLGRHFVGIDIDPEYAKMATEKVENVDVTMYKGYYVSSFLGNIQSIRDIDAGKIFPLQLTSVEKKHLRQSNSCHKAKEREPDMALQTKLWKETDICAAGCPDG